MLDIRNFGAIGDGKTIATAAIQAAIDACSENKHGRVLIAGEDYVTGTLFLKDNVTLHVAGGASLLGSTDIADYATNTYKNMYRGEPHMDRCLIFAKNATSIGIEGHGMIDGQGHRANFPNPDDPQKNRPMLIRFLDCSHIRVHDIRLQNPAAWTSAWLTCDDIVVDGITIHSRANSNGDGLDFDGCRNARVSNCAFDTSDDAICLQTSRPDRPCADITITNCTFSSKWAGIRIGLLSRGNFENVMVSNCVFRDIRDSGLKIQMCEGAVMQNMAFNNLVMRKVPRPVFMTLGQQRCCVDAPEELAPVGQLRRMLFSHFLVDNHECGPESQFVLSGIPGASIEDIVLQGICMFTGGGGTDEDACLDGVAELTPDNLHDHWPECTCFGRTLPAYGLYARHVQGLVCLDLDFDTVEADARRAVVLDDVTA